MEDRLSLGLQNIGYRRIDSNAQGIYLFFLVKEQELSIISIVHAATGNELTKEQYEHILDQIKTNFRNSYPQRIRLLSLILSGNPDQAKHLAIDTKQDSHWIIDIRTNRLIIYETQADEEYQGLRKLIEQILTQEQQQKADQTSAGNYEDNNRDGQGSYNQGGYNQGSFNQGGYNQGGYNQGGNNQGGYNQNGNNQNGNNQDGYNSDHPRGYYQQGAPGRSPASRFILMPVTMGIIALNILAYLFTHFTPFFGGAEQMLEKGALSWYYVKESHEYYRILTSMFMHADWSHLVNNMIVLLFIGGNLERAAGRLRLIFIYFGSGILAGITSISYNMWKEYANVSFDGTTISIGASGAIFGVVGAILYVVIVNKGRLQEISMQQMILFIILTLYSGVINSQIDQAAHVGGFLAGILLAAILYRRPRPVRSETL